MKRKNIYHLSGFCLLLICINYSVSLAASKDTLWASSMQPYGRFVLNGRDKLELISSAVHFGFRFSGTTCMIDAYILDKTAHNYLQYTLDGVYQRRIRVEGNTRLP